LQLLIIFHIIIKLGDKKASCEYNLININFYSQFLLISNYLFNYQKKRLLFLLFCVGVLVEEKTTSVGKPTSPPAENKEIVRDAWV
jgi:hypothetical protein